MQTRPSLSGAFVLCLGLAATGLSARAQTPEDGVTLARAMEAAAAADWDEARTLVAGIDDPVAGDLVTWTRLRYGAGSWDEYRDFLAENPDWPGLKTLRRAGEGVMPDDLPPATVLEYFAEVPPQSGIGALRLAAALMAGGEAELADAEILRAWRDLDMSPAEQSALLAVYKPLLEEHHAARLDMLLWRGMTRSAEAMLPLVDADTRALARARIMTRRDEAGLQAQIHAVPPKHRGDPGLAFERYLYRTSKGRWDEAEAFLLEKSVSAEALGIPDMWMPRRANLARQALSRGEVEAAYALASNSFGSVGADYADSEWMAGYIALTRMDDPAGAVEHFERFRNVVQTPVSLGRAGYWLGLAQAAAGDDAAATAAFRMGAEHQTSFYGQLAAEHAGLEPDASIAGGAEVAPQEETELADWPVIRAALLLHYADLDARVSQFLQHAAEGKPPGTRAAIAQMAIDLGRPHVGIRVGKDAAREGIVVIDQYFPLHAIASEDWPVPTELALAIARQESELNAAAESPAGARGLMQLMPATARAMADAESLPFSASKLTGDSFYNARLGTGYLARLLDRYDGSPVLAVAAYNAGPGRISEWIGTLGDPREPDVDPVIWIESIPYSETRNYVMRVLEGLHVYRSRLAGVAGPVQLSAEMKPGRPVAVMSKGAAPGG